MHILYKILNILVIFIFQKFKLKDVKYLNIN